MYYHLRSSENLSGTPIHLYYIITTKGCWRWCTFRRWKAEHLNKTCDFVVPLTKSWQKEEDRKNLLVDSASNIYLLLMFQWIIVIPLKPQCVHDSRIQHSHHCTRKKNHDLPRQGISFPHPTGWPNRHT